MTLRAGLRAYWVKRSGRGAAHDGARKAHRYPDAAVVLDVGACLAPELDGLRVAANLEPDVLQQAVGVLLDSGERLLAQHLVRRNRRA